VTTMHMRHFLKRIEHEHLHEAIQQAEKGTSGTIVVFISGQPAPDALAVAQEEFRRRGLETATRKNSLLIFLAPKSQTFAVIGGTALHEKVGQAWWDALAALLSQHFRAGDYLGGLTAAIHRAGLALRHHFPAADIDRMDEHDIIDG